MTPSPTSPTTASSTAAPARKSLRCAIYTRKSTEDGLEKAFNSLDAQRDSGEAYVASMRHEGWVCLPDRYDDGGYTGGNTDRPALTRLMADIGAGTIDAVVVYKVDRLSRSLLDFARMMEAFEKHSISFVSVTQQFNTAQSMGRLMLNVLLSFAQFEREIISERTRDKIAAARKKGLWSGGKPVLGYDLKGGKLTVNPHEAARVREIFAIYLKRKSLNRAVDELNARGWTTKAWTNRKGAPCGGRPFHKSRLRLLLGNVTYLGQVRHRAAVYPGEHGAIVGEDLFDRVQTLLRDQGGEVPRLRRGYTSLLGGLVFCAPCGKPMTHSCSRVRGVIYRYHVCHGAQTKGRATCPSLSLPAEALERLVTARVERHLGPAPRSPRDAPPARDLRRLVRRVEYDGHEIRITLNSAPSAKELVA